MMINEVFLSTARTAWYLVHTKPRQEDIALLNLENQGYKCYLPRIPVERLRRGKLASVKEPMFPRYLFIKLDSGDKGKSWSPIRSTTGVTSLVYFGLQAPKVDDGLLNFLRQRESEMPAETLFIRGDTVVINKGPFAGIEAIFQGLDGESRATVLLEILTKSVLIEIPAISLHKTSNVIHR